MLGILGWRVPCIFRLMFGFVKDGTECVIILCCSSSICYVIYMKTGENNDVIKLPEIYDAVMQKNLEKTLSILLPNYGMLECYGNKIIK